MDFLTVWLKRKESEAGGKTTRRYAVVVGQFLKSLGTKSKSDLTLLASREVTKFRDDQAGRLSPNTANFSLKVLRAAFNQAKRDGLIDASPADRVTLLKRRPFTLDELRRILKVADDEWQAWFWADSTPAFVLATSPR